jgi:hypothetical protein
LRKGQRVFWFGEELVGWGVVIHLGEFPFGSDVIMSGTIIHEMHHVAGPVPTWAVVGFQWEVFSELGRVIGEEAVADRKAEEGRGGMA